MKTSEKKSRGDYHAVYYQRNAEKIKLYDKMRREERRKKELEESIEDDDKGSYVMTEEEKARFHRRWRDLFSEGK